jgi:hypothetical protein
MKLGITSRMKILYILGNGFDLWHNIPTSYGDFYSYAAQSLEEFEEYFEQYNDQSIPWSDFENNLGEYDWQLLYQEQELPDVSSDDFRPSMVYGLEDGIKEQTENLVSEITEEFELWINSIEISNVRPQTYFESDSIFLSFNYTSTLQTVYGIDSTRMKHIHGNVDNHEALVFGHCETREEEPEIDVEGDSNRGMFSDAESAARHPFYAFKKPVEHILERFTSWMNTLDDVDAFVILGHSLNRVDIPYFRKIVEVNTSAIWVVSCYSKDDYRQHRETLINIGIPAGNIHTCSLDQIQTTVQSLNENLVGID